MVRSLLPRRRARAASVLPRPDVVVVDYPRASIGGLATNLILAALGAGPHSSAAAMPSVIAISATGVVKVDENS